jgi:hypothetical protein
MSVPFLPSAALVARPDRVPWPVTASSAPVRADADKSNGSKAEMGDGSPWPGGIFAVAGLALFVAFGVMSFRSDTIESGRAVEQS